MTAQRLHLLLLLENKTTTTATQTQILDTPPVWLLVGAGRPNDSALVAGDELYTGNVNQKGPNTHLLVSALHRWMQAQCMS